MERIGAEHGLPPELQDGLYTFDGVILGKGERGTIVGQYTCKEEGTKYAVKFETATEVGSNLLTESLFMKNYGSQLTQAPKYVNHSIIEGRRYLIMELMDHNLEEHIIK